jgi:hypothetical protein
MEQLIDNLLRLLLIFIVSYAVSLFTVVYFVRSEKLPKSALHRASTLLFIGLIVTFQLLGWLIPIKRGRVLL